MYALQNEEDKDPILAAYYAHENRAELICGKILDMSPAPALAHQSIAGKIHIKLGVFLWGKRCQVFYESGVQLDPDDPHTIYEPDLTVVCDPSKMHVKRIVGAPDLIIEVLSPGSGKHDNVTKYDAYLAAGVREYWIVDPAERVVHTYIFKAGEYVCRNYSSDDIAPVTVLEGYSIDLSEIFQPLS